MNDLAGRDSIDNASVHHPFNPLPCATRLMKPTRLIALLLLCFPIAVSATEKTVYGLNEYAQLVDLNVQLAAKLDTGAKTASLSAKNINRFKRNGETWVRFNLTTQNADDDPFERPLARLSKIKRRHGDFNPDKTKSYTERPVIELDICMGKQMRTIEVNLTDRSAFQYSLLIGSEALKQFNSLVDPSLKYATGHPHCKHTAE